jgi:3-phenylpropionate/trans-cinnamate dioxygenase ferredoxin subunit
MIRCPWHAWEFDLRTGQSWFDPRRTRVKAYAADVRSGRQLLAEGGERVAGPYVAETFPVSVEADYVVIELGHA